MDVLAQGVLATESLKPPEAADLEGNSIRQNRQLYHVRLIPPFSI
jgi:hypothetical protein